MNILDLQTSAFVALTEQEINLTNGFEHGTDEHSYYVRLGSISTKLRQRAYKKAMSKVVDAKKHSQESISMLNHTVDLVNSILNLLFDVFIHS